ncbi:RsmB/NOP family class I SAM-dependent RNA methyltransferase [Rhodovulum visakhapatnamense]|nr:RsmB/NOP family class I SAM-dependent RNA methyltransferase [Rhodovulum visakhapatnamense]
MTPAARLQAALDLLCDIDSAMRPADAVVAAWLRPRRHIGDRDRGAILDLMQALLRHQARLGWWLTKHGRNDAPRDRMLVWLALAEGRTPDQIRRLFNGAKAAPAALTEPEHALLTGLRGCTLVHPAMPDEVRLECPAWAAAPLRRRFGATFEAEMAALLTPPPLDLRVNPLRSSRAAVLGGLKDLGLHAEASRLAPHGIRVPERLSLARLEGLRTGEIEIQDEGSQLVALLVDARPGERVADFCAGAGGKTLAIAAQMANKGRLVACDVSEGRLKRCAERLRRAGVQNTETRLLTSETDRWVKRQKGSFDRVLVDAPCSGTGTWRRNPDARWRAPEERGLDGLVALQGRILASAARLVKPGGRLVYATCSMLIEENEDQVAAFLSAHPGFRVVPPREAAPGLAPGLATVAGGAYLSLTPARHDTDGFFAAVLRREDPAPAAEGENRPPHGT